MQTLFLSLPLGSAQFSLQFGVDGDFSDVTFIHSQVWENQSLPRIQSENLILFKAAPFSLTFASFCR